MGNVHHNCAPTNEIEEWAELIDDQTTDRMLTLLAGLSAEARDIVTAYAINGESFPSIGRRYGYGDEWARIRFNRAERAILRKERERCQLFKDDPDAPRLEADYRFYVQNGVRASMLAATRLPESSMKTQSLTLPAYPRAPDRGQGLHAGRGCRLRHREPRTTGRYTRRALPTGCRRLTTPIKA